MGGGGRDGGGWQRWRAAEYDAVSSLYLHCILTVSLQREAEGGDVISGGGGGVISGGGGGSSGGVISGGGGGGGVISGGGGVVGGGGGGVMEKCPLYTSLMNTAERLHRNSHLSVPLAITEAIPLNKPKLTKVLVKRKPQETCDE